jgi:hypothetical protein
VSKHEFWAQWSGSSALLGKNFDATALSKLSRSNKTVQNAPNMSLRYNGVDQVRSLQKIPTELDLANVCVNGAGSASFASTFVQ